MNDTPLLLFDLDNCIVYIKSKSDACAKAPAKRAAVHVIADVQEDTTGIFYAADEDEPQEIADIQELEERIRRLAEIETKTYGTPAVEHHSDIRLPKMNRESENDFSAHAIPLDDDHRMGNEVITALHYKLMKERPSSAHDTQKDGEGNP